MRIDNDALSRAAYRELGPDIAHVRLTGGEEDRRYFTGIEIALVVGAQILISFWQGFFKGVAGRIEESGEHAGAAAASAVLDRLDDRLEGWRNLKESELPAHTATVIQDLDQLVSRGTTGLSETEFRHQLAVQTHRQVVTVAEALGAIGFESETAHARAVDIVTELHHALVE